ncbi:hypothetical protein AB7828_04940 [Tardiphaga sp. 215_C5_N2_1]|uniref:hypothetical protein n=1 Tax=Tardiphaga sp. 215_C5_N2_1 TaxID=3240774 RepID=UPI003F88EF8C
MPYALFEDVTKLSQEFPTEEDAWKHADDARLVDLVDDVSGCCTGGAKSRHEDLRQRKFSCRPCI